MARIILVYNQSAYWYILFRNACHYVKLGNPDPEQLFCFVRRFDWWNGTAWVSVATTAATLSFIKEFPKKLKLKMTVPFDHSLLLLKIA